MDKTETMYLKFFGFAIVVVAVAAIAGVNACNANLERDRRACIEGCGPGHVAQIANGADRCVCGAP